MKPNQIATVRYNIGHREGTIKVPCHSDEDYRTITQRAREMMKDSEIVKRADRIYEKYGGFSEFLIWESWGVADRQLIAN